MFSSFSTTSWILFGVIALVAVVVIWKWWKKPVDNSKKDDDAIPVQPQMITEEETGPPEQITSQPPPMVFAVNDEGNLDLTDMSGKVLNIGYGPSPKTYVGLLDQAEKDTEKFESESGVTFSSRVGTTKRYEVGGRPYIINYTRL
jgi:hypothetical protein